MFQKIFLNLKRAALVVALSVSSPVFGKTPTRESYKDIIEKAQNLSLQKDRAQAVHLLRLAIKKEGKKSAAFKELNQAINDLSNLFLSEKSQQLYELGLSVWMSDPQMAKAKLNEALKNEPDNLVIEMALARLAIAQNDCPLVSERLSRFKELELYIEELRLLYAQAAVCRNQMETYRAYREGVDLRESPLRAFWVVLELEMQFKAGAYSKVTEIIQAEEAKTKHPELFYWNWKAHLELKMKGDRAGQKYLNHCKTLGSKQVRELILEPNLCRRTTEVETYLKKNNNPEE